LSSACVGGQPGVGSTFRGWLGRLLFIIGRFSRRLGRLLRFIERSSFAARRLLVKLIVREVNEDRKLVFERSSRGTIMVE
jgi:hypothetical protein